MVHDDLAASALTAEGTIAGTPAYLSPEQASGKNADARSDVYGLGVTLYESLVGEVPFRGPAIEVLRQVLDDEPRPPRQLDATIPRDLETIVLKSLAKEPARRYQRADEFAADLRRWLNNEPILARPAGRVERTWRWCRRNPKLATLTGLVVTLLTALAVGGTTAAVLISRAYDRAETNRVQAVASQKQAESDADVALKSLVTLVETVQKQMGNQPGLLPLKRKLLETAAEGLKAVVHSPSDAERADRIAVMAHERLGDVYVELGRSADAQAEFSEAHRHAEAWAAREADNINAQRGVAAACDRLGDSAHDAKKTDEAREWYGKAHAQRRRRFEMTPTNAIAVRDLSVSLNKLGDTEEKANDFEAALAHHSESLRLTEQLLPGGDAVLRLQDLRFVRNRLVNVCVSLVDFDAAESHARAGLEHAREYAKIDAVAGRFEIANALERVALVAVYRFDPAGAVLCREESVALRRAMVAADPGNVAAQRNLAVALSAYAGVQVLARNVDAARSAYDEALRLNQAVAAIDPDSVPVWFAQQGIYVLLIGLEANAGRYAEATAWASQAVEFYRRSEENPKLAHLNPKDHRVDMEEIREAGLIAVRAGLADASAFDAQPLGIRRRLRRMRVLDLAIQGKADEAVAAAAELTSRTSETNALEHLVAARACAIVGRAEPAIAALTEAIRLAPMTARELVFYADFYPLRDRSDFQALLPKPKGQK